MSEIDYIFIDESAEMSEEVYQQLKDRIKNSPLGKFLETRPKDVKVTIDNETKTF